ncbi:MAG TPA: DUF2274 domain-containing protein [Dongiaceae bacterium]|jgi:hypothetical protein|nr:DUF2274 domain-containing protein [Dongiaceae bacterium]
MPSLKLPKLPERTSVKISIAVAPDLHRALQAYVALYRQAYGVEEEVATLIPPMLEQFLVSDKEFARTQRVAPNPKSKP